MPPPELAGVIPIDSRRPRDDAPPGGLCGQPVGHVTDDGLVADGLVADGLVADGVTARMLDAICTDPAYDRAALRTGIAAIQDCALAATACADACLGEEMVEELTSCIRTLLNTADVCEVTARVLSRLAGADRTLTVALLSACWAACARAREVCEEFLPIHDHCRVSARACRGAERACRALLASADPTAGASAGSR